MGFSSARSEATSALMIAFVSRPVARPPIDCAPVPVVVWVRSVVELPIDEVTLGHSASGPALAAAAPAIAVDAPAKGGGVSSPTLRVFIGQNGLGTDRLENPLLEQPQDGLGRCVRLSEHCRTGLEQDLVAGEVDHLVRHVGVTDAAL